MITAAEVGGGTVVLACAISAGIHGALVPGHFEEITGAGAGFVAATVLLVVFAVACTLAPAGALAIAVAAFTLAGLLGSYALAITVGLPVLHPDPEPVDDLAVATKVVEAAGLLAALTCSVAARLRGDLSSERNTATANADGPAALTQKQVALRSEMRRLSEGHITWTRLAIISLITNSPDTEATVGRLLKNQTDIGNAVKPFYGTPPTRSRSSCASTS